MNKKLILFLYFNNIIVSIIGCGFKNDAKINNKKQNNHQQTNIIDILKLNQKKTNFEPIKNHKIPENVGDKDTLFITKSLFSILECTDTVETIDGIVNVFSHKVYNENKLISQQDKVSGTWIFEYNEKIGLLTWVSTRELMERQSISDIYLLKTKNNEFEKIISSVHNTINVPITQDGQELFYIDGFSIYRYLINEKSSQEIAKLKTDDESIGKIGLLKMNVNKGKNNKLEFQLIFYKDIIIDENAYQVNFIIQSPQRMEPIGMNFIKNTVSNPGMEISTLIGAALLNTSSGGGSVGAAPTGGGEPPCPTFK